ncbi:MAG: phytanoyl-CoA dioxygenase family protein [Alphaproteobacteria bacterium]|nr:phytanoyl-CoA dioxygenase family protein [Alphaproteobacteria bacterium]
MTAMQLTPQQIKQYHEDGYTVVRGLIPTSATSAVRSRLMELLDGKHTWPTRHFQIFDPVKYKSPSGSYIPMGVQNPADQEDVFKTMAHHANLQGAMSQLLGGPVKLFTDQALIKNKTVDGQSFYHQDSYYWHLKPELGCNCWIALDKVGQNASALALLPGSHKSWTLTPHEQYFDEPSQHTATNGQAYKRFRIPTDQIDFSKEVLVPMEPGDAAFFNNFTWHRAEPNRSGEHICAYAIAYQRE